MSALWTVVTVSGTLMMTILSDLISEEVRTRLDQVPFALLKLASCRLPLEIRADTYKDDWQPELYYILRGDEAKPITRLFHGVRFAVGLWWAAPRIGKELTGWAPVTLRWFGVHVLSFTVLGYVGACAGEILFLDAGAASAAPDGVVSRCVIRFPLVVNASPPIPDFNRCGVAVYGVEGLFVLGMIAAMLAMAVGLPRVMSWMDRQRLARVGGIPDIPGATARFEYLCDKARLTRRRRPRLLVGGMMVRVASTMDLPGGRPLVVIPARLAVACNDPSRFDPVIFHELAHVRARDVSLVTAVRGTVWVTIPAMALACVPGFLAVGGTHVSRTVLIEALIRTLVVAAVTLVVGAGVLRRNEIEADGQAVRWLDSSEPLSRLLHAADLSVSAEQRNTVRWWLRPLARQPSLKARIAALQDPTSTFDVGPGKRSEAITPVSPAQGHSEPVTRIRGAASGLRVRLRTQAERAAFKLTSFAALIAGPAHPWTLEAWRGELAYKPSEPSSEYQPLGPWFKLLHVLSLVCWGAPRLRVYHACRTVSSWAGRQFDKILASDIKTALVAFTCIATLLVPIDRVSGLRTASIAAIALFFVTGAGIGWLREHRLGPRRKR
jgi:Zn-dependent protease with chaperone function